MTSAPRATLARSPRVLDAAAIVCGLLTGFLTPLILNYLDDLGGFRVAYGSALALGGVPFAALVVIIARVAADTGWLRAGALGVLTMVATLVSITLSADTNAALGSIAEPARELIGGPVGGVIGSGLMALAAMVFADRSASCGEVVADGRGRHRARHAACARRLAQFRKCLGVVSRVAGQYCLDLVSHAAEYKG